MSPFVVALLTITIQPYQAENLLEYRTICPNGTPVQIDIKEAPHRQPRVVPWSVGRVCNRASCDMCNRLHQAAVNRQRAIDDTAPTQISVADRMLEFCDLKPGDVFYDFGCGDGRLLVLAARTRFARAVGVDCDKDLVALSQQNADRNGVGHLVVVGVRDLDRMTVMPQDAKAVTLYLFPDLLRRLAPRLENLPIGCSVVSHNHPIPGWPDTEGHKAGKSRIYAYRLVMTTTTERYWGCEGGRCGYHLRDVKKKQPQPF